MRHRLTAALAALTLLGTGTLAVSCNKEPTEESSTTREFIDYTAQAKLSDAYANYANSNFLDNGYGKVTVKMYVDGDTTHFTENSGKEIDARYSNINTPESTADIQKWGKSASLFTQSKLESASTIVLTNPTMKVEPPSHDNNGRWLCLIWYATEANPTLDDFRCLNLEIVQNGYSAISGMLSSTPFYDLYFAAQQQAQDYQLALFSPYDTVDPNYYTGEAEEMTIKEFNERAEEFVGKTVHLSGIVSMYLGVTNVWVEAPYTDPETEEVSVWGVSLFAGYDGKARPLYTVGNEISFTGTVEKFNEGYNITGLTYSIYSPTQNDVTLLSEGNPVPSADQIGTISDLQSGKFHVATTVRITDRMEVRGGHGGQDYVYSDGTSNSNNSMTLYAYNENNEELQIYFPNGASVLDDEGHRITTAEYFYKDRDEPYIIDGVEGVVDQYEGIYSIQVMGTSFFDYNSRA